jgi:carbamoylphosphate synthase small subunit
LSSAILALEDGTVFEGRSFGAPAERSGEVVFNTALTGYQDVFTDPSYAGQIVVLTNPQIGNYGIKTEDNEATLPYIESLAVREFPAVASNWRSKGNILRRLVQVGCRLTVAPALPTADDVLGPQPDGIFLFNGPVDPDSFNQSEVETNHVNLNRAAPGTYDSHYLFDEFVQLMSGAATRLTPGSRPPAPV